MSNKDDRLNFIEIPKKIGKTVKVDKEKQDEAKRKLHEALKKQGYKLEDSQ